MHYEIVFLSVLRNKAKNKNQKNILWEKSLQFIWNRLNAVDGKGSKFNFFIFWLKKITPHFMLITLLWRLRYDAVMGFYQEKDAEGKKVYGMISFQKHPKKRMIGMFDVYIDPERRNKDLASSFDFMADAICGLSLQFKKKGFDYIQCGNNDITRRLLRLFAKVNQKKYPNLNVDVENSRIYLM